MSRSLQSREPDWEFVAPDEIATEALGQALGNVLEPGTVVCLVGELGAGKTRLVRAVAGAIGADPQAVTSPTFVLHQEYSGRLLVQHFDAYRLRDSDEFIELGAVELMEAPSVSFIEWGDRVVDVLSDDLLRIEIDFSGPTARRFRFFGSGPRSAAMIVRLRDGISPPATREE